jgi:hypothetical protein
MNVSLTLDLVRGWITHRLHELRRENPDRGDVPGWVIVTAITVTLALAIGVIIVQKITDKANTINLQ